MHCVLENVFNVASILCYMRERERERERERDIERLIDRVRESESERECALYCPTC